MRLPARRGGLPLQGPRSIRGPGRGTPPLPARAGGGRGRGGGGGGIGRCLPLSQAGTQQSCLVLDGGVGILLTQLPAAVSRDFRLTLPLFKKKRRGKPSVPFPSNSKANE